MRGANGGTVAVHRILVRCGRRAQQRRAASLPDHWSQHQSQSGGARARRAARGERYAYASHLKFRFPHGCTSVASPPHRPASPRCQLNQQHLCSAARTGTGTAADWARWDSRPKSLRRGPKATARPPARLPACPPARVLPIIHSGSAMRKRRPSLAPSPPRRSRSCSDSRSRSGNKKMITATK